MRRVAAVVAGLVSLAWFSLLAVPPAAAFPLTTCTLTVTSMDASGTVIGTATGSGMGGTRDDPLLVDQRGTVEWTGTTGGSPITQASYHVEIFDVPTPLQGSTHDDSPRSSSTGSVRIADFVPFDLVGLVYVSGGVNVNGSPYCEGSGWIRLAGDPVGTPGFLAGTGLGLVGLATVLASTRRRHLVRGGLGGLIGGAGLALLSGVTGILPLDETTPVAALIGSLVLGLLIGVIDFADLFRGGRASVADGAGGEGRAEAAATTPERTTETPEPATTTATTTSAPTARTAAMTAAGITTAASSTTGGTPSTSSTTAAPAPGGAPAPASGLATIRAGIEGLPEAVRTTVSPLFSQAEGILRTGPGTLTIGADVIGQVLAQAQDAPPIHLVDGAIRIGDVMGVRATPVVQDGRVSLSFVERGSNTIEGIAGLGVELARASGLEVAGASKFEALDRFLDNVNRAVADAGQRIRSVAISPSGVVITTGSMTT